MSLGSTAAQYVTALNSGVIVRLFVPNIKAKHVHLHMSFLINNSSEWSSLS